MRAGWVNRRADVLSCCRRCCLDWAHKLSGISGRATLLQPFGPSRSPATNR
jgi:hypothetical protein